ncbi:squalene/phytoene synthase family protein [Fluviispira multicolorata]|uniref:Phytoene/squalene synthase family protein n=1 Tax=Fluviispira multicolorata TaxID=2654512 RepID=A0A833N4X0_9BACT|nr:squalene/phytoene synthase family protein [Fluviispira multicolorata]KAB8029138.1 phytoene/squalene synthase family protein [Fluviispira multicolorata]
MDLLKQNAQISKEMLTPVSVNSLEYCETIINHVSRSFSLGINLLKGEIKKSVLIGYLLCRIIDTVEDDQTLETQVKEKYLRDFLNCFENIENSYSYSKISELLKGDKYHLELVQNTHKVFDVYFTLSQNTRNVLQKWVTEMCQGMILFISKQPNGIRIQNIKEYKSYCYYVAGTVGYLLTDLWKEYGCRITEKKYNELNKYSGIFGEALQTINILKDVAWDAKHENSIYIPQDILAKHGSSHEFILNNNYYYQNEKAVKEIMHIANDNLNVSLNYIKGISKFNFRIRFFCIFPLLMAFATLKKIKNAPNLLTPEKTIKVSRGEVKTIVKLSFLSALSNNFLIKSASHIYKLK